MLRKEELFQALSDTQNVLSDKEYLFHSNEYVDGMCDTIEAVLNHLGLFREYVNWRLKQ